MSEFIGGIGPYWGCSDIDNLYIYTQESSEVVTFNVRVELHKIDSCVRCTEVRPTQSFVTRAQWVNFFHFRKKFDHKIELMHKYTLPRLPAFKIQIPLYSKHTAVVP